MCLDRRQWGIIGGFKSWGKSESKERKALNAMLTNGLRASVERKAVLALSSMHFMQCFGQKVQT